MGQKDSMYIRCNVMCVYILVSLSGCLRCLINLKLWLPLARLTYTSYLIHAVVISRFIYAQMSLVEITQDNIVSFIADFSELCCCFGGKGEFWSVKLAKTLG